jgi:hypothetical protein
MWRQFILTDLDLLTVAVVLALFLLVVRIDCG